MVDNKVKNPPQILKKTLKFFNLRLYVIVKQGRGVYFTLEAAKIYNISPISSSIQASLIMTYFMIKRRSMIIDKLLRNARQVTCASNEERLSVSRNKLRGSENSWCNCMFRWNCGWVGVCVCYYEWRVVCHS